MEKKKINKTQDWSGNIYTLYTYCWWWITNFYWQNVIFFYSSILRTVVWWPSCDKFFMDVNLPCLPTHDHSTGHTSKYTLQFPSISCMRRIYFIVCKECVIRKGPKIATSLFEIREKKKSKSSRLSYLHNM